LPFSISISISISIAISISLPPSPRLDCPHDYEQLKLLPKTSTEEKVGLKVGSALLSQVLNSTISLATEYFLLVPPVVWTALKTAENPSRAWILLFALCLVFPSTGIISELSSSRSQPVDNQMGP
jgi:hypothetical protein